MTTPTEKFLEEVKSRLEKSTPGPWKSLELGMYRDYLKKEHPNTPQELEQLLHGFPVHVADANGKMNVKPNMEFNYRVNSEDIGQAQHDAYFIANSPTDISKLLRMCEEMRSVLEQYMKLRTEGDDGLFLDAGFTAREALRKCDEIAGEE